MQSEVNDRDKPVRRQVRSLVTQRKLLDAAIAAFSESGFRGTSTRDIAERAGVHHPLITYHFRNKENLWQAAADRVFGEFTDALTAALAESPATDTRVRAETRIRTYVRFALRCPALHQFVLQESSRPGARLDWLVDKHIQPLHAQVVGSLEALQQLGAAPSADTSLLFNMIRASAGGLAALKPELRRSSGIDMDKDGAIDEIADLILRVFISSEPAEKH